MAAKVTGRGLYVWMGSISTTLILLRILLPSPVGITWGTVGALLTVGISGLYLSRDPGRAVPARYWKLQAHWLAGNLYLLSAPIERIGPNQVILSVCALIALGLESATRSAAQRGIGMIRGLIITYLIMIWVAAWTPMARMNLEKWLR